MHGRNYNLEEDNTILVEFLQTSRVVVNYIMVQKKVPKTNG